MNNTQQKDRLLTPRRLLVSLFTLLLASVGVVFAASAANAAVIPNALSNLSLQTSTLQDGASTSIETDWAVPDNSSPGDTFAMTLPAEFSALATSFPLEDPDGNVVATASVSGQLVTFTLNSFVATHPLDVHGTVSFGATFHTTQTSGTVQTNFQLGTTVVTVPVTVVGTTADRTSPAKTGGWVNPNDQGVSQPTDALYWQVVTGTGPWTQSVITDTPGAGTSIDCSTLQYSTSSDFDANGNIVSSTAADPADYTLGSCTASGLTVTFHNAVAGQVFFIGYSGSVTDPSLKSYTNSATVVTDGVSAPAIATVARFTSSGTGTGDVPTPTPTPTPTSTAVTPTTPATSMPTPAVVKTGASGPALADTGSDLVPLIVTVLVLLGAGAGLSIVAARKRAGQASR